MAVSYHCHPGRKLPASPGEVYSGVSFVFRLFVSTAARFRQARGAAAAAGFAAGYLRAAPWAPRWSVFLDRLCQRRFGTAAPLNLILGGLAGQAASATVVRSPGYARIATSSTAISPTRSPRA